MTIGFSISRISTEQFAVIEETYDEKAAINLNTNLRFAVDKENRLVVVFGAFQFQQKQIPFIKVEVACHFKIAPDSWSNFIKEQSKIVIPKDFMCHLGMITVGTTRGVLHTKTEGTKFNHFVLPTINVKDIIQTDITFA